MELLNAMIQANTVTDDRVAAFFTLSRHVLTLQNCGMIRNSILRQIPFRCPQLVIPIDRPNKPMWMQLTRPLVLCSAVWICPTARK